MSGQGQGGYGGGYGGAPQQMGAGGMQGGFSPYQYQGYGGMGYQQQMANPYLQQQMSPYAGLLNMFAQMPRQQTQPRDMGGSGNYASPGGAETIMRRPVDPVPGWNPEAGGGV